ncbi:hypothetical protein [Natrinema salifodinae]|uniref:DUF8054 domain-containing protein n=1 Tax=Natrinema salifodinae TaxID=1202768 RepID=A0A1I0P3I9_9EURY|nr:hypothetical protein [Natrinema salifodinae]SEW08927.1 hypothetical protein SAMN05216285_2112 [Natrinema salifodinae]
MTESDRLVGDRRCWPCTLANAVAAAIITGVPLLAAVLSGEPVLVVVTVVWAVAVFGYTVYRLLTLGYLPGSESVAKATGLHDRIGPETSESAEEP